jgi:hypothetical protein
MVSLSTVSLRTALSPWVIGNKLPAVHREQGIHIDERTGPGRWGGERMDDNMCVAGMQQREQRPSLASQRDSAL